MLSHGGILSNCSGALNLLSNLILEKTRFLTWLPLSHSYEHTVQFVQISLAAQIFYAESIDKLIKNMNENDFLNMRKEQAQAYSQVFPDDMETKKLRKDLKICLFNNSYNSDDDEMPDIEEIKKLW